LQLVSPARKQNLNQSTFRPQNITGPWRMQ
jgi:hypothetical protein